MPTSGLSFPVTSVRHVPAPGAVWRVAPSPTGWLHIGNAFSAVVTWAIARRHGGRCLLRIEDLDEPRCPPWAKEGICADLTSLGLVFDAEEHPALTEATDGGVLVQSRRHAAYQAALARLIDDDVVYACRCSRKDLAMLASAPHVGDEGPPYPGTCRSLGLPLDAPDVALRVRVDRLVQRFGSPTLVDRFCGPFPQDVVHDVGDIVVRRRDGQFSYQLAVVVDDAAQGVTEVTRGRDLLSSAPRQALLHRALGSTPPSWAHLPLVVGPDGARLSKRSESAPALVRTLVAAYGAPRLVGHLLSLLGLRGEGTAASLEDFVEALDEAALRRAAIEWSPPS
jgi:glutamyl-tRNA synthetase